MDKRNKKDIRLILAASFCYCACPMIISPLITGFAGSIGTSAFLMGLIGGLMNLCSLSCRPLVGNLADKISKYKLAFGGVVFLSIACTGYIVAADPIVLVVARVINGIGFACCSVAFSTWLSDLLPANKIGAGMGIYGLMNSLAMAVSPAMGVRIYQAFGYRTVFALALIFSVIAGVFIQFVSDKDEASAVETVKNERKGNGISGILEPKVIPIALIVTLFAIPYCATQSFLVNYTESRALPVTVSLYFPVYAIVLCALRVGLKDLFDKLPFKIFFTGSLISAALGIGLLGFMDNNMEMFLAAAFMAGGYGIMCSVCQSTAVLVVGKEKRGRANGTYYVGLDLGLALGPIIGGALFGKISLSLFYPVLLIVIPLKLMVYAVWNNKKGKAA